MDPERSDSDELPSTSYEHECILCCGQPCTKSDCLDNITDQKWDSIQEKSLRWKELDRFQNVHENVDWENGPKGYYMHNACYTSLSSKRCLSQAEKRKRKLDENLERGNQSGEEDPSPAPSPFSPKKLRSSVGIVHDKNVCVWCNRGPHKSSHRDWGQLLLLSTKDAWKKFKLHTVHVEDPVLRSRLNTLIASIPDCETAFGWEIRYHRGCWRDYISHAKPLSDEVTQHLQNVNLREAQAIFFNHVRQAIFENHEFRTVQSLLQDYQRIISNHGHDTKIKSSYVKEILLKEFEEDIGFHKSSQQNVSEMVFDIRAAGSYVEAALSSLGISDDQLVKNVAVRLREQVKATNTLPWPPNVSELEREEDLNELLLKLITWLKHPSRSEVDDNSAVRSIGSILTSYIMGMRTAFEVNLSILLHGLTKSREIIDLLHKDGIGISYNDVLMLRDFWVFSDLKGSLNCPSELAFGKPAIAVVDNDDFKSDTLTGAGQAHRTNVMFVQPETFDEPSENQEDRTNMTPQFLSTSLKEIGSEMQHVKPYKTVKRGQPPIRKRAADDSPPQDTSMQRTRGVIHALARAQDDRTRPKPEEQTVPGFSGFQARMSNADEKSRAIYHMTYPDPPSKTVLNNVLCKLAKAIEEKRMPFAIIVGDHPVYVLMLELKSENPLQFSKILPFMGAFHIQMSFIYTIYKRFHGSGLSDVLVAAGVIADGSVDQALRGKHFKRGVRCLRLFYETLVHHALDKRLEGSPLSEEVRSSLAKLRHEIDAQGLADVHTELEQNAEVKDLIETLFRDCDGAPLAEYWISFMEMVEILTQNIHALRTSNWNEYKSSLKLMLPWMQIYDNDKYGRHLPDFIAVLDSLPEEQAAFMKDGMFAQSMTGNPYSCVALDIWIESTMNKGSKLKSGWLAILNNEKQLLSNTRNVNNINRVRRAVHHHANRKGHRKAEHADCSSSRRRKDEQAVQDISSCLNEFECDPFDHTNQTLRSLQSGIPASDSLAVDLASAKTDGRSKVKEFMDERVYSKTKTLNDRVHRSKRKNFSSQEVKRGVAENLKGKAEGMERDAMASVVGLVDSSGTLQLEDIMQHRVTPECLSIFNANGTFRKSQKSKLLQKLNMDVTPEPEVYTSLIDMGLIWRLAVPTIEDREKRDGTKYTWGDYAQKMVNTIKSRHPNAERIICVNDSYDQDYSIKDSERILRQKQMPTKNVFMKAENKFPSSKDFHALLGKPDNKIRLQAFLQEEFQKVALTIRTEIVYCVVGSYARNLTTGEDLPELLCFQAEADTAIFTMYSALRSDGYKAAVILDTEDTDNYVQAAYVAHRTSGNLCLKRKHRLIDAKRLCSEAISQSIIPIHVISGCDHNSAFFGASKLRIVGHLINSKEAHSLLAKCGTQLPAPQNVISDLEQFVIRYVYGNTKSKTPGEARAAKWRAQKKKSTMRLMPDSDSLYQHLLRANYLAYLLKHFQLQSHPSPIGHGWHLVNGLCLPVRSTEPPLPLSMSKTPKENTESNSDESSDGAESDSDSKSAFSDSCIDSDPCSDSVSDSCGDSDVADY